MAFLSQPTRSGPSGWFAGAHNKPPNAAADVAATSNPTSRSGAPELAWVNPFNPTTTIKYQIPELSFVTLKVYDVLGNEIATLVYEEKPVGSYEVDFNAIGLPSGIYFYKLQAGSFVETKKMVLMK